MAAREGRPEAYPVKTKKLKRTSESLWLLQAQGKDGAVWLQKRPTPGVWAGLYCLPVFQDRDALAATLPARTRLHDEAAFVHVLTHKDLHLHPVRATLPATWSGIEGQWFAPAQWPALGLPTPVRRLLLKA